MENETMMKLTKAVMALALALFAAGALAQNMEGYFTQGSDHVTVAHELFGSDAVKLEFADFDTEPMSELTFGGMGTLEVGTEFSVTYTLTNAVFAESASFRDFNWGVWGTDANGPDDATDDGDAANGLEDADNCVLGFTPRSAEVEVERDGGRSGTNSVTYTVKVLGNSDAAGALVSPAVAIGDPTPLTTSAFMPTPVVTLADCSAAAATATGPTVATNRYLANLATRMIRFDVPDVNATGLSADSAADKNDGKDVGIMVSISQTKSTGTDIKESVQNAHLCGGEAVVGVKSPGMAACPAVEAVKIISGISATAGHGMISLAADDGRAVLVKPDGKHEDPQRVKIATVTIDASFAGGASDQDGDAINAEYGFTNDLAGSLAILVSSQSFRDGDMVYIDYNGNKKIDGREEFEMDGNMAMDNVPLKNGSYVVYYVPNGKDALKHNASFTTSASTEFANVNNRVVSTPARPPATGMLTLHGVRTDTLKAYAIAPLSSTDIANVRVTCESSAAAGCMVFLDCKDTMGVETFGDTGIHIGPNMTARWQQSDIAEALMLEDGWMGRLSCEILSTATVSAQVLTRANGVLVNNTYVAE